jgi:hypothetical protein
MGCCQVPEGEARQNFKNKKPGKKKISLTQKKKSLFGWLDDADLFCIKIPLVGR